MHHLHWPHYTSQCAYFQREITWPMIWFPSKLGEIILRRQSQNNRHLSIDSGSTLLTGILPTSTTNHCEAFYHNAVRRHTQASQYILINGIRHSYGPAWRRNGCCSNSKAVARCVESRTSILSRKPCSRGETCQNHTTNLKLCSICTDVHQAEQQIWSQEMNITSGRRKVSSILAGTCQIMF